MWATRSICGLDYKAPNGRVLKVVQGEAARTSGRSIIPEGKDVLEAVNVVGGKMYVLRLKDVKSELTIYSLEGKELGHDRISRNRRGFDAFWDGRSHTDGFYSFQSIIHAADDLSLRHEDGQVGGLL